MQSNRHRDTGPELAVRRLLHAAGLRYRVDVAPLGGRRRADIVFTRQKVAVFIDGCFWHNCPLHGTTPKRNNAYWRPKLARNKERDSETNLLLQASGWTVLRYWEHQDALEVSNQIIDAIFIIPGEVSGKEFIGHLGAEGLPGQRTLPMLAALGVARPYDWTARSALGDPQLLASTYSRALIARREMLPHSGRAER